MTGPASGLSAEVLARLLLIQAAAGQLPDDAAIVGFVCRGLEQIPGVGTARHDLSAAPASGVASNRDSEQRFPIRLGSCAHGDIVVALTECDGFLPYAPHVANLAFMTAVLLEERRQRRLSEATQRELEARVEERTSRLSAEIAERLAAEEERTRLQADLVQAQKMESIGRLAGGVAHDFNNMIQAILGNVQLALDHPAVSEQLADHLHEIQGAARRSADLTRQLLAFARKQMVRPKVLDLNDTVQSMLKMLQRLIGEHVQLVWLPGAGLWPIRIDPAQVDQVLANLAVNARDAISGGGRISIATANLTLDESFARTHSDGVPGDYVALTVSDSGAGMDQETVSHLFEPFFTTKEVGAGTGLGLATVYGIVKQNDGLISVASEPGAGSTFTIFFPRVGSPVDETSAVVATTAPRGNETILLVEDEAQILKLGQSILTRIGYTVLTAQTPAAALELIAGHDGPIHLLVTDVVMPGMNGRELQARVAALKPGIRSLFMSGYTLDVIAHQGVVADDIHFLEKPFTIASLSHNVRAILDGAEPS